MDFSLNFEFTFLVNESLLIYYLYIYIYTYLILLNTLLIYVLYILYFFILIKIIYTNENDLSIYLFHSFIKMSELRM